MTQEQTTNTTLAKITVRPRPSQRPRRRRPRPISARRRRSGTAGRAPAAPATRQTTPAARAAQTQARATTAAALDERPREGLTRRGDERLAAERGAVIDPRTQPGEAHRHHTRSKHRRPPLGRRAKRMETRQPVWLHR